MSPKLMSPAELDAAMYALIDADKTDTSRYAALQREHDRRDR